MAVLQGVGIEVGLVNGYFVVTNTLTKSPAAIAGLEAGDRLVAVAGQSLKGRTLREVVTSLRGKPGTSVALRVFKGGNPRRSLGLFLTRVRLALHPVHVRFLNADTLLVRIGEFHRSTPDEVRTALQTLDKSPRGIVLDLRNNPGGLLDASVELADYFLTDGLITSTRGRTDLDDREFYATQQLGPFGDLPIAVLIDQRSASASEVIAGALQDHGRATVLGTKSYGKGSIQSVLNIGLQRGVKLTTGYYYTPSGRSINEQGITPDVLLEGLPHAEWDTTRRQSSGNPTGVIVSSQSLGKSLADRGTAQAAAVKFALTVGPRP